MPQYATTLDEVLALRSDKVRLRAALEQINKVLHPADCLENMNTVAEARKIATQTLRATANE